MKTVRKFLFENDFDAADGPARNVVRKPKSETAPAAEPAAPPPPPPPPEPTFSEAELTAAVAEARAKALKEGLAKGKAEAQAQIEAQIAATLAAIGKDVVAMSAAAAQDRTTILGEAAGLARAMVGKMLPELTRRGGLAEIEATIERCLFDQRREPRLNVRVSADLLAPLQEKIGTMAAEKHFEGRINLIADAGLDGASCRIEWADGGLERDAQAIWRDIAAALDRCLATQGIEAATVTDETMTGIPPSPDGASVDGDTAAG